MNKVISVIVLAMLTLPFVYSAEVPQDVDTTLALKIQQEAQTTRQVMNNNFNTFKTEFLNEYTKRGDYYEKSYQDILSRAVIYLGLLWAGVYLFVNFFGHFIRTRTERKKYQVLKESLVKDVMAEIKRDMPQQSTFMDKLKNHQPLSKPVIQNEQQMGVTQNKMGYWEKRKLKDQQQRIENTKKEIARLNEKLAKVGAV